MFDILSLFIKQFKNKPYFILNKKKKWLCTIEILIKNFFKNNILISHIKNYYINFSL